MLLDKRPLVPLVDDGVVIGGGPGLRVVCADGQDTTLSAIGRTGRRLIEPRPESDFTLQPDDGAPLPVQAGGWAGRVVDRRGGLIMGWARNTRRPGTDCAVVAVSGNRTVAVASARAAEGGRFVLRLPPDITGAPAPVAVTLGVAGSDYRLDGGRITVMPSRAGAEGGRGQSVLPRPLHDLSIRIKISTPNLKEAPMWGDYHFANSLTASFQGQGLQASVDTADVWYKQAAQEDVVLTIRGRHRVKTDPEKINLMWIISHPDRIPEDEYDDYDHVFVASDIYAAELRARGLPSVSVLHQATDSSLFFPDPEAERDPTCLFVGNSRREYRTMVRWCIERDLPLALYGGGWEGILPPGMVRGTSIANADLPDFYRGHLLLLNDHWDSMRDNGFLSNRLFDGSGVATPILTDPVAGLADVFGDAISEAGDAEHFAAIVAQCMADPAPFLEKARRAHDIVMAAHTFDHRASEIVMMVDRIAARRRLAS
ncbi:CgeB family protein [Roseovarius aestuariivivens]|uniref:CgeB family protein n=1 Tax=Roseovarius aestuariivivens TaxID=1888910 RepID=UPI001081EEDF|nr:glycosyltransferase [Roseovarius aestuariivivens]